MGGGAFNEQQGQGEQGDAKIDIQPCAVPFRVDQLPQKGAGDADAQPRQHVGGVMHAEVQPGKHDQKDKHRAQRDGERPAQADGEGGKKAARCRGMSAGEAHVRVEVGGGNERVVHVDSVHDACGVRARPAHGALDARGETACRHHGEQSLFARAFGKAEEHDGDDRRNDKFFAQRGKDGKEHVQKGTAYFFQRLQNRLIHRVLRKVVFSRKEKNLKKIIP